MWVWYFCSFCGRYKYKYQNIFQKFGLWVLEWVWQEVFWQMEKNYKKKTVGN